MGKNNMYASIIIIYREKMCVTMTIERKDVCYDGDESDDKHIDYI